MTIASYGTITPEDVEEFRRHIQQQIKETSPAKARERLIESGALAPNGRPRPMKIAGFAPDPARKKGKKAQK